MRDVGGVYVREWRVRPGASVFLISIGWYSYYRCMQIVLARRTEGDRFFELMLPARRVQLLGLVFEDEDSLKGFAWR
jgi:hypothetical protein